MTQKISKFIIALLAIVIGLYPAIYFIKERTFGLLMSKSNALLENVFWNTAFYMHIIPGGIALLIGWLQFNSQLRRTRMSIHRMIGKLYIVAALVSATAGIALGFCATGGFIPAAGFICLGIIWFATTLSAYRKIKQQKIEQHRRLVVYSYAACFAAVTLRIWLPVLIALLGDFIVAYSIVAWLCWVPNLLVAKLIVRKLQPYQR